MLKPRIVFVVAIKFKQAVVKIKFVIELTENSSWNFYYFTIKYFDAMVHIV